MKGSKYKKRNKDRKDRPYPIRLPKPANAIEVTDLASLQKSIREVLYAKLIDLYKLTTEGVTIRTLQHEIATIANIVKAIDTEITNAIAQIALLTEGDEDDILSGRECEEQNPTAKGT